MHDKIVMQGIDLSNSVRKRNGNRKIDRSANNPIACADCLLLHARSGEEVIQRTSG